MQFLNHSKAYILGLLVGGGKIDRETFIIDLPFNKWGMEPQRMNNIALDILTKICGYFKSSYGFDVTYEIINNKWLIKPVKPKTIDSLISDLQTLGLPRSGFLLNTADLSIAKNSLNGVFAENFLSGIFDARASLTESHRRFNNDAPVVSIEIPGSTKNFTFVVQLCSWLTDLGSTTDQILYNHPNQHSAADPYYRGWKKGFKIRFLAQSFLENYSFALKSKTKDVVTLAKRQTKTEQLPCYLRKLGMPSPVSIHVDQNSTDLPELVRSKIFFHYHHFCSLIGCQHAPKNEIERIIKYKSGLINFFPRLFKGSLVEANQIFEDLHIRYFNGLQINSIVFTVKDLINKQELQSYLDLKQGVAFLFSPSLGGKRHKGNMKDILSQNETEYVIVFYMGNQFENPLLIVNNSNDRAFVCSSVLANVNQQLIRNYITVSGFSVIL